MVKNPKDALVGVLLFLKQCDSKPNIEEATLTIGKFIDLDEKELLQAVNAFCSDKIANLSDRQMELVKFLDEIYKYDVG